MLSGTAGLAVVLGAAMVALQASIGALNDVVDAPGDAGRQGKPIPSGRVTLAEARSIVIVAGAIGLGLSAVAGWGTLLVGLAILAVGYGYDLWAKGTPWSWLPFAVGIPLLPVYASLGVTGGLGPTFAVLTPAAGLAGAFLAVGNALADVDLDRSAGSASVATALGERRSMVVQAGLLLAIAGIAAAGLWAGGVIDALAAGSVRAGGGVAAMAVGLIAVAVALVGAGRSRGQARASRRRAAWAAQAIGIAIVGAGWVAASLPA